MPEIVPKMATPRARVGLGIVTLGYTPQNHREGEFVRQALQDVLMESNIFDQYADHSLNIVLQSMIHEFPVVFVEPSARTVSKYLVKTTKRKILFQTSISSIGTARYNESFVGAERLSISIRRSIASNLSKFAAELSSYLEYNSKEVEIVAAGAPNIKIDNLKNGKTTCPGSPYHVSKGPSHILSWSQCFGTFIDYDSTYVGDWRYGRFHGYGTSTYSNGDIYVGEWKDDEKSGQGTLTFANGVVKVGIWENNDLKYAGKNSPDKSTNIGATASKDFRTPIDELRKENDQYRNQQIPEPLVAEQIKPKLDQPKRLEHARRTQEALQG
jgi:hypothetical protein